MDQCNHMNRVHIVSDMLIPGGLSIGQCKKECVPYLTKCFEHADKEALYMLVQQLDGQLKNYKQSDKRIVQHVRNNSKSRSKQSGVKRKSRSHARMSSDEKRPGRNKLHAVRKQHEEGRKRKRS